MPEVSVIVPVYNAERFLPRCIDSILSQEFKDFELILINDGSNDCSADICDEYAKEDQRIRVLHQNNSGAAYARNEGISVAIGTYLAFCDCDDVVSPNWLKRLLLHSETNTLVVGAYCTVKEELGQKKDNGIIPERPYNWSDYFSFYRAGIAGYLCNALYHRELVESLGLRLRENKIAGDYNEDLIFAVSYARAVNKIIYTGYSDYFYDTHENSLSRGNQSYYFEKYAEKYRVWEEFLQCFNPDREDFHRDLATSTLYHFIGALRKTIDKTKLSKIVHSAEMKSCLNWADTSHENRIEIALLQKQRDNLLWMFYKALIIKEKIKK